MTILAVLLLVAVFGLVAHAFDLRARLSRLGKERCSDSQHTYGHWGRSPFYLNVEERSCRICGKQQWRLIEITGLKPGDTIRFVRPKEM